MEFPLVMPSDHQSREGIDALALACSRFQEVIQDVPYRTRRVNRFNISGILPALGDQYFVPKILQMPKRHEHGPEDNAASATSRNPPAENVGQPNPSENHPDHATIARWLKLADELLVENNDRKKA